MKLTHKSLSQFPVRKSVLVNGNDLGNDALMSPRSETEWMNCPHEEDRMVPVAALRLEEVLQAAWSPVSELLPRKSPEEDDKDGKLSSVVKGATSGLPFPTTLALN